MSLSLDKNIFLDEINNASSVDEIEKLRIHYLGKKGIISLEMKSLSSLSIEDKKIKEIDDILIFINSNLKRGIARYIND